MALTLGTNCGFVTAAPTADPAGTSINLDNYGIVMKHTLPADAVTITEVGFWVNNDTEAANWRAALYDDDGATVPGEAGTRLFLSSDAAKGTTGGAWKAITGLTWDVSSYAGTDLWIGIGLDDTATATALDYTSTGGNGMDTRSGQAAMPDPFGGGALSGANARAAIYAVYTTAAGDPEGSLVGGKLLRGGLLRHGVLVRAA